MEKENTLIIRRNKAAVCNKSYMPNCLAKLLQLVLKYITIVKLNPLYGSMYDVSLLWSSMLASSQLILRLPQLVSV